MPGATQLSHVAIKHPLNTQNEVQKTSFWAWTRGSKRRGANTGKQASVAEMRKEFAVNHLIYIFLQIF